MCFNGWLPTHTPSTACGKFPNPNPLISVGRKYRSATPNIPRELVFPTGTAALKSNQESPSSSNVAAVAPPNCGVITTSDGRYGIVSSLAFQMFCASPAAAVRLTPNNPAAD